MPEETQTTSTEPTPDKPKGQPQPPPEDAPVLTQKQADAIIGSRVKEASAASLKALAEELGFADVDAMKAAAKEAKQRKDDEKSELDKAKERLEKAEAKAAELEKHAQEIETARVADRVNTRIETLARNAKAKNPEDVVERLRSKRAEDVAKLVDDKGAIDDKAVEKLIADVKKDRPEWFAITGQGSPSNKDGRPPQPDADKIFGSMPKIRL